MMNIQLLARLGVREKIYFGFGGVLLLAVAATIFAIIEISTLSEDFDRYTDLAQDALLASEINADMAKTQMNCNYAMSPEFRNSGITTLGIYSSLDCI